MTNNPQDQQAINQALQHPVDHNQQYSNANGFGVLVVLGVIDDWRVVVRGGDAATVQHGEVYRIVWTRIPVRDFPSKLPLGLVTLEKARCRVIEVYEQFAVMQSIASPEETPWLVATNSDIPPIAVGDEVERV